MLGVDKDWLVPLKLKAFIPEAGTIVDSTVTDPLLEIVAPTELPSTIVAACPINSFVLDPETVASALVELVVVSVFAMGCQGYLAPFCPW